ncbi:MAG: hypothetical protein IKZ87_02685 [Actinomycetaceae bacterium]|nr:hypothetical protein [Actinomycetaceae bacterium]
MSYNEVVSERSFINILLLNKTIPSSGVNKKDDEPTIGKSQSGGKRQKKKFRNETELFMSLMG